MIGGLIDTGVTFFNDLIDDGQIDKDWKEYAGSFAEGFLVGGAAAATGGSSLLVTTAAGAGSAFVGNVAKQAITKSTIDPQKIDWGEAAIAGVTDGVFSVAGHYAGKLIKKTKVGQTITTKIDDFKSTAKNKISNYLGIKTALADGVSDPAFTQDRFNLSGTVDDNIRKSSSKLVRNWKPGKLPVLWQVRVRG